MRTVVHVLHWQMWMRGKKLGVWNPAISSQAQRGKNPLPGRNDATVHRCMLLMDGRRHHQLLMRRVPFDHILFTDLEAEDRCREVSCRGGGGGLDLPSLTSLALLVQPHASDHRRSHHNIFAEDRGSAVMVVLQAVFDSHRLKTFALLQNPARAKFGI